MNTTVKELWLQLARRVLFGASLLALLVVAGIGVGNAGEIMPSIGVTRARNDSDADAKVYGGLAVRGHLAPFLMSEIGVAYRRESRLDDALEVRMWPVTASLWFTPLLSLYAGGGVGWYHTTFDYDDVLPIEDETHQKFGMHLGGGFEVPLAPVVALDLNGRYVFLEKENGGLPPREFDPDFWSTTLGLAIRF